MSNTMINPRYKTEIVDLANVRESEVSTMLNALAKDGFALKEVVPVLSETITAPSIRNESISYTNKNRVMFIFEREE